MSNYKENFNIWYKEAIIYQLHVKTFYDSNGDGIGDFEGLIKKLDYLKNLGVTALWLLPFYPSPLKDDGYDITDYYNINPKYGTLRDFKEFLREAHERGLKVITELVINHTSDQHPWFTRAKQSPSDSKYRNYYVWSNTPDKYKDARIIFKDFEKSNWTWCEEAKAYYWHRFYSHQPDLNFESTDVQKEIFKIIDFWLEMGVDGLRLDAIPYLFEQEGTNCENLPQTHIFLKKLRKHIDKHFQDRMLLAEANQWPEDAVQYFGKGDECHMAFHFPLMPRIYLSVQKEDRFPIIDIIEQTPEIPDVCQWVLFLRNHDELTLEMVTDEERDYLYNSYAKDQRSRINLGIRRRLLPLLSNNRRKFELMNILLFSLQGTPVIYYGDEIGMGDNRFLGDRDGMRTPMQWSPDRNAGFSKANPQQLYLPVIIDPEYHYETVNVETQENNLSSLLWWMRRVIAMRKRFKAFSYGKIKFLYPSNPKVLCFTKEYIDEKILVIINLSRFSQSVELNLQEYAGLIPEEVFSQNNFPVIKDTPYLFTLGPYDHFWFLLKKEEKILLEQQESLLILTLEEEWEEIFLPQKKQILEEKILPIYLKKCVWFSGRYRKIINISISEIFTNKDPDFKILFVNINYSTGNPETYFLPISFSESKELQNLSNDFPEVIICKIHLKKNQSDGFIYDALYNNDVSLFFLSLIQRRREIRFGNFTIESESSNYFKAIMKKKHLISNSRPLKTERFNISLIFDNFLFMKFFRKIEEGIHPEIELSKHLSKDEGSSLVPNYCGSIEITSVCGSRFSIAVLQKYIQSETTGWVYFQNQIQNFFEAVLSESNRIKMNKNPITKESDAKIEDSRHIIPPEFEKYIDTFFVEMVSLLGKRTAEMHLKLSDFNKIDFKPEPFSLLYQRAVYQSMGSKARYVIELLRKQSNINQELGDSLLSTLLSLNKEIINSYKILLQRVYSAKKIRTHGDYNLTEILFTGKDFVIIDFEGNPEITLSERRIKRCSLRDIAGMIMSFFYVAYSNLLINRSIRKEDISLLEPAVNLWLSKICGIFWNSYLDTFSISKANFLPSNLEDIESLLKLYILDKLVEQLSYELNNRPNWIQISVIGIIKILNSSLLPSITKPISKK